MPYFNTQSTAAMADYVVEKILAISAIKQINQQTFTLALAGGTTPKLIYQQLAQHKNKMSHWQLLYSDERFLPANHPDRNERLFLEAFGDLPAGLIHQPFLSSDRASLTEAKNNYQHIMASINTIDMCLLGMGEDGHSASLFPDNINVNKQDPSAIISLENSPKMPPQRLSFNYSQIHCCEHLMLMVAGQAKHQALANAIQHHDVSLPITHLITQPHHKLQTIEVLADKAACQDLAGFNPLP